jgi:hypothetical protein
MRCVPLILLALPIAACGSGDSGGDEADFDRAAYRAERLAHCRAAAPADVPIPFLDVDEYCACAADAAVAARVANDGEVPQLTADQRAERNRGLYRRCIPAAQNAPPLIFDPDTGELDMRASEGAPVPDSPPPEHADGSPDVSAFENELNRLEQEPQPARR